MDIPARGSDSSDSIASSPSARAPDSSDAITATAREVEAPAERWRLDTFRSLRHRNYRLYFIGQVISLTGTWLQTTALAWLAYSITRQSLWTSLMTAAQMVPLLLLGGWGGALADRKPKRHIIIATQTAMLVLAVLLGVLVLAGQTDPWLLLAIAIANGIAGAIDLPARLAFAMDMVGRDDIANAVALNSMMFNVARVIGPALGAFAYNLVGPGHCFLLNGLSYVAVIVALVMMDVDGRPAPRHGRRRSSLWTGARYLTQHAHLLLLLVLSCALSLFGWPALILLPALAKLQLHAQEQVYGTLLSLMGAGALISAFVVASFSSRGWQKAFLATGVLLTILALVVLARSETVWMAGGGCVLLGMGLILFFPTGQAIMQLSAGEHNRGVIMGIWSMVFGSAVPLGGLLAGRAADRWGVSAVLLGEAAGVAVAAAAVVVAAAILRRPAEAAD
jgi:MFS family permease